MRWVSRGDVRNNVTLDRIEVLLERLEEALGLQVLGRSTNRQLVVLDNVADTETVLDHGTKAENAQRRVTAVGRRKNDMAQSLVAIVGKELGHSLAIDTVLLLPQGEHCVKVAG